MALMTAYRLVEWGHSPEYVDVEVPKPGPGEVLVKMAAAGICGSDLHLTSAPKGVFPIDPPFTLGHENAGWVADRGLGATRFELGSAVLASSATSCGQCEQCLEGWDNYCWHTVNMSTRMMSMRVRGIGNDGGLAEYVVVPERELVPLGTLAPERAAPLADAGATSYHAVRTILAALRPGSTVAVIGAGGLGSYAIQYLRLLSPAHVIAVDKLPHRLDYARALGAEKTFLSNEQTAADILAAYEGMHAVIDFCGSEETLTLANTIVRPRGHIVVPGITFSTVPFGWGTSAAGCQMNLSLGFTLQDLNEVVRLAREDRIRIDTEAFSFQHIDAAFNALREGRLKGRAVISIS
ncbi:MAG: putative alcohol dehydrogenase protein [Verrucomicrobiaceae bacterium]|nr:putative alcohol dehydrogenase protein [Verrucomicrobiaceae bacterium]